MNFALPVSTYLAFSAGQTSLWKAAQWLQVIEAYSMIVAGASAAPSTMSGSGPGCISAAATAASEAAAAGPPRATSARSAGRRKARGGLSKPCHRHLPRARATPKPWRPARAGK